MDKISQNMSESGFKESTKESGSGGEEEWTLVVSSFTSAHGKRIRQMFENLEEDEALAIHPIKRACLEELKGALIIARTPTDVECAGCGVKLTRKDMRDKVRSNFCLNSRKGDTHNTYSGAVCEKCFADAKKYGDVATCPDCGISMIGHCILGRCTNCIDVPKMIQMLNDTNRLSPVLKQLEIEDDGESYELIDLDMICGHPDAPWGYDGDEEGKHLLAAYHGEVLGESEEEAGSEYEDDGAEDIPFKYEPEDEEGRPLAPPKKRKKNNRKLRGLVQKPIKKAKPATYSDSESSSSE